MDAISPIGAAIAEISKELSKTLDKTSPLRRSQQLERDYRLNKSEPSNFDNINLALNAHMKDHMSFLMKDLADKHDQLTSFLLTLDKTEETAQSHDISKRGLIDGGGSILSWLFGVATEDQVVDTRQLIEKVTELAEKSRVQINLHSEILNTTSVNFKAVEDHMSKITDCLGQVRGNIMAIDKILNDDIAHTYLIMHSIILTNSLSYASSAISDLASQFLNLKIGLNKLKSGFLSPEIIPPATILKLVEVIQKKNLKPIYPSSAEYLSILYKFIRVDPVPLRPMTYIISIPLLGDPKINLELYEIFNMPHPVTSKLTITYSGLPRFLGVSDDRRMYQEYQNMDSCRNHGSFYLCPTDDPIYRDAASSCALNLFQGQNEQMCERHFSGALDRPLLRKTNIGWLYSVSEDHEISITCASNTSRVMIPTGSGRIHTESNCKISAKDFILPSEAQPTGQALKFQASLLAPFTVSLTFDEIDKIQLMNSSDLLTNIMVLNNDVLPLKSLKNEVKNLAFIKKMRQINSITANTGIALSSLSFIGVLLIFIGIGCFYIVARDRKNRERVVQYINNTIAKDKEEDQSERLIIREGIITDDTTELGLAPVETESIRKQDLTPRSPLITARHTKVISQESQHFDNLQSC